MTSFVCFKTSRHNLNTTLIMFFIFANLNFQQVKKFFFETLLYYKHFALAFEKKSTSQILINLC